MARLYVTSINLNKNELQNARIQNLSSAPSTPVTGQVYYNTADNVLYFWNGTAWISMAGSTEVIQDVIGSSIVGGTGLTATYNDTSGETTLDLDNTAVTAAAYGTTAAKTVSFTVDAQGRLTAASQQDIAIATSQVTGLQEYIEDTVSTAITAGEGIDVTYNDSAGTITIDAELASDSNKGVASFDATDFTVTSGNVVLNAERVSDIVGAMVTGNTETGITVTYQDSDNTIDFEVADQFSTHTTDNLSEGTSNLYFTDERAQDAVNTALTAGTGITKTYDDTANTITVAVDTSVIATRTYVDTAVSGLDWHTAVNLVSNSNISLTGSSGTLTIDGHTALSSSNNGYRLLLKGQSTASENGIYVYNDAGSGYTLTRATDADSNDELIGAAVYVMEGTTYGTTAWIQTNHYITGFATQSWVQFSGAGTYTAGAGLTSSGTTFNVGAGTGITVNANDVAIDTSVVARKYSTNIGDGTSTSYTVTHNLGTQDTIVQVYDNSTPYAQVEADVEHPASNTNTITVKFATAPTSNQYRVVVLG